MREVKVDTRQLYWFWTKRGYALVWRDTPERFPVWSRASSEYGRFYNDGTIADDTGADQADILKRFGISAHAEELPIEVLMETSPHKLLSRRRNAERVLGLTYLEVPCSEIGEKSPAHLCD